MKKLIKELYEIKTATDRLNEAVEMDSYHYFFIAGTISQIECSDLMRSQQQLPEIKQNQLEAFTKALRSKLLDRKSGFGKEYLKLLETFAKLSTSAADS